MRHGAVDTVGGFGRRVGVTTVDDYSRALRRKERCNL
jgi:hypothetical protein